MSPERHPLAEKVLSGGDPALARLAAEGALPLPPAELARVQVALADTADAEIAAAARASLAELPAAQVTSLIADDAPPEVLRWFAIERREPAVIEAVLRTRSVPRELLEELARRLPPKLQELLLVRQDAILERPAILDALAENPELSIFSRRRIGEIREHLLASHEPEEDEEVREDEPSEEEVAEALEEARAQPDKGGDRDDVTGLSESQIRTLPVAVRRKLARTARGRTLRDILLKDPNPTVALTVLKAGGFSDGEIEKIASSRAVAGDVLDEIARRRDWVTKYKIMVALVKNPRTPAGVAVRLLPRVSVRELGLISRDHNVSHAVRSGAKRLYSMKRR